MTTHPTPLYTMNARRIYCYSDTSPAAAGDFHFPRYENEDSIRQSRALTMESIPGVDGAVALGGDDTALGEQVISKRFTFHAATGTLMQAEFDAAMAILSGGQGRLWRYTPHAESTMQYQWTPVLVAEMPLPAVTPESAVVWPCVARFTAKLGQWFKESSAPHVYGEAGLIYGDGSIYGVGGKLFIIDDAAAPYSVSLTVANRGNAWARAMIITVTAGAGGISGLVLTNSTTGHVITMAGALTVGQYWEIDTYIPSVKKYTGSLAYDWTNCTPGSSQRGLFALAPGNNTVVASSSNAMDGTVEFEFYEPSV